MTLTPLELTRPASTTDALLRRLVARVPGSSGATWKLAEVYTGETLVELPQSTPADIEQAFAVARIGTGPGAPRDSHRNRIRLLSMDERPDPAC